VTRSTFGLPTLIALLSLAGLMLALTGEGLRDGLSWAALSAPLLAVVWAVSPRKAR
jgi:hypothetical protein